MVVIIIKLRRKVVGDSNNSILVKVKQDQYTCLKRVHILSCSIDMKKKKDRGIFAICSAEQCPIFICLMILSKVAVLSSHLFMVNCCIQVVLKVLRLAEVKGSYVSLSILLNCTFLLTLYLLV